VDRTDAYPTGRTLITLGAVARLAALVSCVAPGPAAGSGSPAATGQVTAGTATVLALYAASGMALYAAAPRAGRAVPAPGVLFKGTVSVLLALGIAVFAAARAVATPGDALPYALTAALALVDLAATGLVLHRLRRRGPARDRPSCRRVSAVQFGEDRA
jgi:hypothetical protein